MASKSFRLRIFPGRTATGEPLLDATVAADEVDAYRRVRVAGFSGSATVQLDEVWRDALARPDRRCQAAVVSLETIVKFGATQQLRETLTALIEPER